MESSKGKKSLSLQGLRAFHLIMRTGSGAAAAKELGMSQPGVSRLITQLEKFVGFELFYRDRSLIPTADGLLLYQEVNAAFTNIDRIDAAVRDIRNHNTGQLKIVASPGFIEAVLSDVVAEFLAHYPKVRLHLDPVNVETAKAQVAGRTADCGFVKLPFDRSDIHAEKIVTSDTVCVFPRGHALSAHKQIGPKELEEVPLIQLASGTANRREVEDAFKKAKIYPNLKIETHGVGAACALAARGLGVAVLNELMARHYLKDMLEMRPFRPKILHEFVFITSSQVPMSRLTEAFADIVRKHFRRRVQ